LIEKENGIAFATFPVDLQPLEHIVESLSPLGGVREWIGLLGPNRSGNLNG
jgi:hypothetical protein